MKIGETVRPFIFDNNLTGLPDLYALPNKFSLRARREQEVEQRQIRSTRENGVGITEEEAARGLTDSILAQSIRDTLTEQEPSRMYGEAWVTDRRAGKDDPGLDKVYPKYPSSQKVKGIVTQSLKIIKIFQDFADEPPASAMARIKALEDDAQARIANAFEYPTQGGETVEQAIDVVETARIAAIGPETIRSQGSKVKYAEFPGSTLRKTKGSGRRTQVVETFDDESDVEEDDLEEYSEEDDVDESGRRIVLEIPKEGTPPTDPNAFQLWQDGVVVLEDVTDDASLVLADLAGSRQRIRQGAPVGDNSGEIDGLGLYTDAVRNEPTADLAIRTYHGVPTPGSFHGDRVRAYRRLAFEQLRNAVDALAPTLGIRVNRNQSLLHEPLVGPLTIHTGKGGGESWTRDNGRADKGIILEAWLNMGNNTEDFVYVPGSHSFRSGGETDLRRFPHDSLLEFDDAQELIEVPPGAMVIYFRTLVRQTFRPSARPDDRNMRLYVGAAMYAGKDNVKPVQNFTDKFLEEQAMVRPVIGPPVDGWRTDTERAVLTSRLVVDKITTLKGTTVPNYAYAGTPYAKEEREAYQRRAVVTQAPGQSETPQPSTMDTTKTRLFATRAHTPIRL